MQIKRIILTSFFVHTWKVTRRILMSCVMNLKGNRLLASHFSIGFMKKKRSFRRILSSMSDMELLPGTCSWTVLLTEFGCCGCWFLLRFIASISAITLETMRLHREGHTTLTQCVHMFTSNECAYKYINSIFFSPNLLRSHWRPTKSQICVASPAAAAARPSGWRTG